MNIEMEVLAHACSLSTGETEKGGSGVQGQPGLHNETLRQASKRHDYLACILLRLMHSHLYIFNSKETNAL